MISLKITVNSDYPTKVFSAPYSPPNDSLLEPFTKKSIVLLFELSFIIIITVQSLAKSFGDMANITKIKYNYAVVPRQRWIILVCGIMTIYSGIFGAAPILLSADNSSTINAGARTGRHY